MLLLIMTILYLSDLHIPSMQYVNTYKYCIEKDINMDLVDTVCITGDIFESGQDYGQNPKALLAEMFPGKDVVFTLGNHEFAFGRFQDTMEYWNGLPAIEGVHCLDAEGKFEKDGFTFVGNVLWYDFTMGISKDHKISNLWLDASIKDFDPVKACNDCQDQIISSLNPNGKNVLLTHTCPHDDLNAFMYDEPLSPFNCYSGMKDFLKKISSYGIECALCGHTHRRAAKEIHGIQCWNIGNDYFMHTGKVEKMLLDL